MDTRRQIHTHRSAGHHPVGLDTDRKLDALLQLLTSLAPGTITVSGGLDSRLLAHLANSHNLDYTLLHFTGPHVAPDETAAAAAFLQTLNLPHAILQQNPLNLPQIANNHPDRCYHCKYALFHAARLHSRADRTLVDGTNASDHNTYRPGLRALKQLGVLSPYALANIAKPEIQHIALATNLPNPDQPATPCLLTRLPYNHPVTTEILAQIAKLESHCRQAGFTNFRVRWIDDSPKLFADPEHKGFTVPDGLAEVVWTEELSGFWDKKAE